MTQQPGYSGGVLHCNVISPRKHITSIQVSPNDQQIEEGGKAGLIMQRRTTNNHINPAKFSMPLQISGDAQPEKLKTDEYDRRIRDGPNSTFQTSSVAFRGPLRKEFVQKVNYQTELQFSASKSQNVKRVSGQGSQLNNTQTKFSSEAADHNQSGSHQLMHIRSNETP